MSTEKIYVGDIGTAISLDCKQDVTAATVRSIEAKRPDESTVSWTAIADGTARIRFVTLAGSLDMPGKWKLQAKVTLPSGTWRGRTVSMTVYNPFE